ncbi:MAG TPA: VOC family protein [Candidatus Binataceae bacterium]|nr:VOC family protein [Candidatus Binataceae bacterium]
MASVSQLGYLGLNVSDLGEWERFATEVLGLQVADKTPEGFFLRMDENHHRFVVRAGGDDDVAFVGWEVADQRTLEELGRQLKADGVEATAGSDEDAKARGVIGLLKFKDPSGIPTEAYFGPLMNYREPFNSPRPLAGFETGTMGLGHIVVRVDDAAKSLHFYRDVLGMRVSDFIDLAMGRAGRPLSLAFMHCNPRHHSIAFGEIPAKKRLMHFMLQTKALDDVCSTMYLAQDRAIPISGSLGRHTNDHMVSFYMRSPSGFEIEYGFGARTVDDATWKVQHHQAGSIWGHRGIGAPPQKQNAA